MTTPRQLGGALRRLHDGAGPSAEMQRLEAKLDAYSSRVAEQASAAAAACDAPRCSATQACARTHFETRHSSSTPHRARARARLAFQRSTPSLCRQRAACG